MAAKKNSGKDKKEEILDGQTALEGFAVKDAPSEETEKPKRGRPKKTTKSETASTAEEKSPESEKPKQSKTKKSVKEETDTAKKTSDKKSSKKSSKADAKADTKDAEEKSPESEKPKQSKTKKSAKEESDTAKKTSDKKSSKKSNKAEAKSDTKEAKEKPPETEKPKQSKTKKSAKEETDTAKKTSDKKSSKKSSKADAKADTKDAEEKPPESEKPKRGRPKKTAESDTKKDTLDEKPSKKSKKGYMDLQKEEDKPFEDILVDIENQLKELDSISKTKISGDEDKSPDKPVEKITDDKEKETKKTQSKKSGKIKLEPTEHENIYVFNFETSADVTGEVPEAPVNKEERERPQNYISYEDGGITDEYSDIVQGALDEDYDDGTKSDDSYVKPLPRIASIFIPTQTDSVFEIIRKGFVVICMIILTVSMVVLFKSTKQPRSRDDVGANFVTKYVNSYSVNQDKLQSTDNG